MLKKVEFKPGVVKDDTALTAETTFVDAQWMRFRRGKPEVMGGWEKFTTDTFTGYARNAHSWQDNDGNKIIAWGTEVKLYAYLGGEILEITPNKAEGTLTDPFTSVNGSAIVTVEHDQHGLLADDTVSFSHATAVGGLTVDGAYTVTEVLTPNKYTITHASTAGSAASGGGYVDFIATLETGLVDGLGGRGYGTVSYGIGPYGEAATGITYPRTWSLANWGENLLANPRGGGLFEWQPATSYPDIAKNGDFALASDWTTGTGWSLPGKGTKTAGVAANLSQDQEENLIGGKTYRITFSLVRSAGELQLGINAGLTSPAIVDVGSPVALTGSYSRLITMPAEPLDLVFQADSAFAGTVDNVTIALEDDAYRIDTAPAHAQGMVVAADRIVILYGTIEADGDYNPLLLRWSDRENNRTWVPAAENVAGEISMSYGGLGVTGLASREQNLFWSDGAVYSLVPDATDTYGLVLLGEGPGAIGPMAVCSHSGRVFWLTKQGVPYTLQSSVSDLAISQPIPIESGVQKDLFDNLASGQEDKIQCFVNPEFTEFWILYPDDRDGIEVSRYQAYNWVEKHWTTGTIERTTIISSGVESYPIGFGLSGGLYFHEKGESADGNTISAYVETGDFDIADGKNLMHIRRMVPDFEDQQATITTALYSRPWAKGARTTHGPFSFTTTTEKTDMRATGRIFAVRFSMTSTRAKARFGSLRFDVKPTGMTR